MIEASEPLPDEVELLRFRDGDGVSDCCEVLKQGGVAYRLATDAPAFDYAAIGGGTKGTVIVMVQAADDGQLKAIIAATGA